MKSRIIKYILIAGICALLLTGIVRYAAYKKAKDQLHEYNQAFVNALRSLAEQKDEIAFAELIPNAWDTLYVFGAYTTEDEKFAAAGCEYNLAISNGVSESQTSLLFMNGDEVSYYVEFYPWWHLVPASAVLVIDSPSRPVVFKYEENPHLVRVRGVHTLHTADEVVMFMIEAD